MVERLNTVQSQAGLAFSDVVKTLEEHLSVTRDDILRLFSKTIGCSQTGEWSIDLGKDRSATTSKDTGVRYKIGVQTIKQWNKETQTMQPREIPILISREHIPEETVGFTTTGHKSDSFEAGPGVHPGDK